jgi:hypothetical protein
MASTVAREDRREPTRSGKGGTPGPSYMNSRRIGMALSTNRESMNVSFMMPSSSGRGCGDGEYSAARF